MFRVTNSGFVDVSIVYNLEENNFKRRLIRKSLNNNEMKWDVVCLDVRNITWTFIICYIDKRRCVSICQ